MIARSTWALCCALALAGPAQAQSDAPGFADFSARRVAPPPADAPRRITVQIAPRANPAVPPLPAQPPAAVLPGPAAPAAVAGAHGWFWAAVSPKLADSGPGRLEPALAALARVPQGAAPLPEPRLSDLRRIAEAHGTALLRESVGTRVSPALALAVIAVESGGDAAAVSGAGAQGLMQLMPGTADRFGVSDPFDPDQNIAGGIAFLDFLMGRFDGDPILVLAGYNAGENAIPAADGVPAYAETRDYVPKVLAAFRTARALCVTPPQLVSDGCVFARP